MKTFKLSEKIYFLIGLRANLRFSNCHLFYTNKLKLSIVNPFLYNFIKKNNITRLTTTYES